MADRSIASRPSLEQVHAIVDFMEQHPALAMGQLRGLEGRDECKKLWLKLTRIVNDIAGPTRPMKSWIKYWADKKSTVRSKVVINGLAPINLSSNIEKKIWDLFLNHDTKPRNASVKQETHYLEENFYDDDSPVQDSYEEDPVVTFKGSDDEAEPVVEAEDRQTAIMEKLVKVMNDQAAALSQLAQASTISAQAMERLAEASNIQARALDRLANTFDTISGATHEVRNALMDIDGTMKRIFNTSPT